MSFWKDRYENHIDNTYGVEMEFATHADTMLAFTHITVCWVYHQDAGFDDEGEPEVGWHFETDADNTLELVSPILTFDSNANARKFKDQLKSTLYLAVRKGATLDEVADLVATRVAPLFAVAQSNTRWTATHTGRATAPEKWKIAYISHKDLLAAVNHYNWDEDSDLERVLAAKAAMERWTTRRCSDTLTVVEHVEETGETLFTRAPRVVSPDHRLATLLSELVLSIPRKHGGFPSSQMNIPLTLKDYVRYQVERKRWHEWSRLLDRAFDLQGEGSKDARKDVGTRSVEAEERWRDKKQQEVESVRNEPLSKDEVTTIENAWRLKYLHGDYVDTISEENERFWHRYWLWCETFSLCARELASGSRTDTEAGNIDTFLKKCMLPGAPLDFASWSELIKGMYHLRSNPPSLTLPFQLTYVALQKAVCGALAELSETKQLGLQEQVMALKGALPVEAVQATIEGAEFLQFHFAVKDLTALWFKGALVDVVEREPENTTSLSLLTRDWGTPEEVADFVCRVFQTRLRLLRWYHSVRAALNRGFEYEFDDFVAYNMPNLAAFREQLVKTIAAMQDAMAPTTYICRYADTKSKPLEFLVRTDPDKQEGQDKHKVAPWEARWDTIKGVIPGDTPKYLVEHRNN